MLSKREAGYEVSSTHLPDRCGKCSMYKRGGQCTLVRGRIDYRAWCEKFDAKKEQASAT